MITKHSVSLILLPILLVFSAGIDSAKADDIKVRNGDMKVTVGDNGNIKVRNGGQRIDVRDSDNNSDWWNRSWIRAFPNNRTSVNCGGGTYSSQSTRSSSSGGTYSRSTTSTTTCR
jgi:hypothetical protein